MEKVPYTLDQLQQMKNNQAGTQQPSKPGSPPPFHTLAPVAKKPDASSTPVTPETYNIPKPVNAAKKRNKKPRTAIDFGQFKSTYMKDGHAMFYRHFRLPDDTGDSDNRFLAKGGATLLVHLLPQGLIRFSFSVCHKNDQFEKDPARRIVQNRYYTGQYLEVQTKDDDDSYPVVEHIFDGLRLFLREGESRSPLKHYQQAAEAFRMEKLSENPAKYSSYKLSDFYVEYRRMVANLANMLLETYYLDFPQF